MDVSGLMQEALLLAKVLSKQPRINQYNAQLDVHLPELHDTESRVAFLKYIFEVEMAQPCLHNLARCEQSFRSAGMGYLVPSDQIPNLQKPL